MNRPNLIQKFENWHRTRTRFPIRRLTYKQRVLDDVERLYRGDDGPAFFDEKYTDSLAGSAKQLENWELKLFATQFAISVFVVLGFISTDASISLFGISLKHAAGLKEFLLVLAASLSVAIYAVLESKRLRLVVIEKLTELRSEKKFLEFAKLAIPAPYQLYVYVARQFEKWIFPTLFTRSLMFLLIILFFVLLLLFFAASIAIWVYLFVGIFRQPTLGFWSYGALVYSSVAYLTCIFWFIRAHLPLPYRDMEIVQQLRDLEHTDRAAYARRLREVYGESKD